MASERVITPFPDKWKSLSTMLSILLIIVASLVVAHPGANAETPEGFYSMDQMTAFYPSKVLKEGDVYHVQANLDIPASRPLYMGPGTKVLFDDGLFLNLTGAPLFEGSGTNPVHLGPYQPGQIWGGINLFEGDPTTSSVIINTTIEGAQIGVRSHSSDLSMTDSVILNCSRNGLDIKGPMGTGNSLDVKRTRIANSTYYGIHLLKVENLRISDLEIVGSGTGIRSYKSIGEIEEVEISESNNIGLNAVDSSLDISGIDLISEEASTSHQILILNSTVMIADGHIAGSNVGISALTGTSLEIDGVRIEDSFSDGIQTSDAEVVIQNTDITTSGESGVHLLNSAFRIYGTTFNNNGEGTGDLLFSSIYSEGSEGKFEGCTFTGSGYSHIHSVSSDIMVGNSTLGSIVNEKMLLDEDSRLVMVDTVPPSDVGFLDEGSKMIYQVTLDVTVLEHSTMDPVTGAQVDLRDVDGEWIGSAYTGPDGMARDMTLIIFERDDTGTYSYLPVTVIVQKDGYEVTSGDIDQPLDELELVLYPPNDGPSISLTEPTNGTKVSQNVVIKGDITDDLGIFGLKVRFDEGFYRTYTDFDSLSNGRFVITIPLRNLSGGLHTLWVHAFDGAHISLPERRTIMVLDPRLNDTDEDGIPDMDEDVNGNGLVDPGETDPENPDTDGDGLIDGIEIDTSDGNSTDPL
ncbi:MAG: Ig-like domain-containing protein, partial [Thermoplasmatota archaeon]